MSQDQPAVGLETVRCSVCASEPPARPSFCIGAFPVVKCPKCGVLRVSPRLNDASRRAYYGPEYWRSRNSVTRGYFDYAADAENIRRTFARRLRQLRPWAQAPGKMLDIGCAMGFLVEQARAAGWEAQGVDWSASAIAQAPPEVRTHLHQGTLLGLRSPGGAYDLVTLWDYLEHAADPCAELAKAAALLKPGGCLSVIMPDAGSWLARLLGSQWEEYKKPEEHLYFFTRRQLARVLTAVGLIPRWQGWAGKYASLAFASSRFQPGDGLAHGLSRAAGKLIRAAGWGEKVVYINPRDKMHVIACKEPA